MTQSHPFLDDVPAYALGALDPEDAKALESHLQTCEICRSELASYEPAGKDLLLASRPQKPPARLRREIQKHLPGSRQALSPRVSWSFRQAAVGMVLLLLVALNIVSIAQIQTLRREQAVLTRQVSKGQAALALLASTGTKSIAISTGNLDGTLLINQSRNSAIILLWNLPELQRDQIYQAWLIDPQGKRTSAGIFEVDTELPFTSKSIIPTDSLSNFVGIGVTIEPAGGSQQPTGKRVFKVDF